MTNQYEDLYNKRRKAILLAEARYIPRLESTNIYVTALPPKRNMIELVTACSTFPGLPPQEEYARMSEQEQLAIITRLSKATICLPYYMNIEESVDRALIESYEKRVAIKTNHPYKQYVFNDNYHANYEHMEITELSDAPTGLCVLGISGCGKTTGINSVLRKYPRVIIHNPGTLQQHIQIPVLLIHMTENNNFHGLYQSIGETIDAILCNATSVYGKELSQKSDSLSIKFNKFCKLIQIFNVGLIIIDEIELLETAKVKEGTLETFMGWSNRTGVAIGAIGTEDAFEKLFRHPRATRRLGDLINADSYCSSKRNIQKIMESLYSYLPEKALLTEDCLNAYCAESGGTIAYLSKIFVGVAKEITKQKSKGKLGIITPELITRVAKKTLAGKQILDKSNAINRIVVDDEYSQTVMRELLGKKDDEEVYEMPATPSMDYMPTLRNIVKMAIHAYPGNNYTDEEIESALHAVIRKISADDTQSAISATFIELENRKKKKEKKAAKTKQQEQAIINLQELRASLPVANIQGGNCDNP